MPTIAQDIPTPKLDLETLIENAKDLLIKTKCRLFFGYKSKSGIWSIDMADLQHIEMLVENATEFLIQASALIAEPATPSIFEDKKARLVASQQLKLVSYHQSKDILDQEARRKQITKITTNHAEAFLIKKNRALSIYVNGRKVTELVVPQPVHENFVSTKDYRDYRRKVTILYSEVRRTLTKYKCNDSTTRKRIFKEINKIGIRYIGKNVKLLENSY